MSTIDFTTAIEQKDAVVNRFEFSSSYLELSIIRMQRLQEYLSKITNEYSKHAQSLVSLNSKKLMPDFNTGRPIAPGLPGFHTARYEILNSTMKQVSTEFTSFSDFINIALIEPILDFTVNTNAKLKEIVNKYNEYKKFRKTCKESTRNSLKDFNNAASAAEKAYKEYNAYQKANKMEKIEKSTKNLKEACKNYQKAAATFRINTGKFNTAHYNFIKYTQEAIKTMNAIHPQRVDLINSLVNKCLIPSLTTFANTYRDVQGWFEQSAVPWDPDFKKYVNATGIVRMMIKPQDFITNDGVCYPARITQLDAPIFIGTITKDFSSDEHFKMNVTAGQRVGLYENLTHHWVLARDPYGQKRYIPSSCVKIEKSKIALVRAAQLGNNSGILPVSTGELLLVIDEKEYDYVCENVKREQGTVPKYAVFIEEQ
jgi:hypothetical protein